MNNKALSECKPFQGWPHNLIWKHLSSGISYIGFPHAQFQTDAHSNACTYSMFTMLTKVKKNSFFRMQSPTKS